MRSYIFKRFLTFLEKHPVKFLERIEIQILCHATAKGFQRKGRCLLFSRDARKEYAVFTKECMREGTDQRRLFNVAIKLGRAIRKVTGFTEKQDLQRLVFLLYKNIGITMNGKIPGTLTVTECYFSRLYNAEECRCISAMDQGIIAGICDCGALKFTERLTSGCDHCTAYVKGD